MLHLRLLLSLHSLFGVLQLAFSSDCSSWCYFVLDQKLDWETGRSVCEEEGGWMIAIETQEENDHFMQWLPENNVWFTSYFSGPYIGIRRSNAANSEFQWSHEKSRESTFSNWKTDAERLSDRDKNCGAITLDGSWLNFNCDDQRSIICEIEPGKTWNPTLSPSVIYHETLQPTHRPSSSPTMKPTLNSQATSMPTLQFSAEPTLAPTDYRPTMVNQTAPTTKGNTEADGGAYNIKENVITLRLSHILIVGSCVLFTIYIIYRQGYLSSSSHKNDRIDDTETNSSHNLVEMETIKMYGGPSSDDDVDLGGCFAFGSSPEEMLASQLNMQVYSSVRNDANEV